MLAPHGPLKRALSSVLATMMIASCLPFSAVSTAVAASASVSPTGAFATYQQAGPAGMRKAPDAAPTKVNVRWRRGVPAAQLAAASRQLGFKTTGTSKLGWVQLTPARYMTAGQLATALRQSGLVIEARAAVTYQATGVSANLPNDPLFSGQYGLYNTGQTGGTPGADISAAQAWSTATGSKNVIVAVVDEGVNISHPDLKNNIWINTDEVPGNGVDDDKNGYVDDVRGYDFANDDATVYDAMDGDRHGTHVAGIIGAQGNNGVGATGVNWNVSIMPVKFLGPGGGDDFAGAKAITYAVDNGARVINCSWGGEGESPVIEAAIDYANDKGVLIAAAAGNSGSNNDSAPFWPAASDSPNVITVAATDHDDMLAEFSNFGDRTVDIAAPGVDVTSTLPAESAGIYVDYIGETTAYKVMYLPIQVESLEPASSRDAIIERSVARLGAVSDTEILVVDDSAAKRTKETQGTRLSVYLDALSDSGFHNVTSWVTDTQGTPTAAAMQGKVVVWFTGKDAWGWYEEYCISKSEQDAIASYLDNGGRLFMASGEMATDLQIWGGEYPEEGMGEADEGPYFVEKYFHATIADLTHWTLTFSGKVGTPMAGLTASLPAGYLSDEYLWPTGSDLIVPLYDMPGLIGGEPVVGEGELPVYPDGEDGAPTTETPAPTRESVQTMMQVGKYGPLSGTSMAAPMVSGALALLMSQYPTASSAEIEARVLNTTDQLPTLKNKTVYGGRLNVMAAMSTYPGRPTITGPSPSQVLLAASESTVTWNPAAGGDPDATFAVELGLPYSAWGADFEDGTLGEFVDVEPLSPWSASTNPEDVYGGAYGAVSGSVGPAVDNGDGWITAAQSGMTTTITVPPGGGTLEFQWRANAGWDQLAEVYVDNGANSDLMWETTGWTKRSFELSPGQHTITWMYVNLGSAPTTPEQRMAVDDVKLTAHDFSPLGTAPAGAKALAFTVPTTDTADAWFRVQATNGVDSAWAYSRGHRITTDLIAPGAPSGFSASAAGDGVVELAWTNPTDLDYSETRVLWREGMMPTGPEDASATVSYEGTATAASLSGLKHGAKIYAAAYAIDGSGNLSSAATASVDAVDVTAPSPVRFLQARMISGGVGVNWMSPAPQSFSSITVLRRTDTTPTVGDPAATTIYSGRGSAASDWTLPETTRRAVYAVYAEDESGNKSAPVAVRITPDITAPEGELLLNGGEPFTADPDVDVTSDITGANEMRIFVNGDYDPEAPWVPFDASTTVGLLPIDGLQTVEAEYRDWAGNYFSTQAEIYVDLMTPAMPTELRASNWNVGVRLSWDDPADDSVVEHRVWKSTSSTGPWSLVDMGDTGTEPTSCYVGGLTAGRTYYFKVAAVDGVGHVGPQSDIASITVGEGVVRRFGKTRYETAVNASASHFESAETVVLVSGTAYADALGAAPLAGVVSGPVLLTPKDKLDLSTAAEIKRLGATDVIIVGGEGSVAPVVAAQLVDRGLKVSRIGGADRYEVAGQVALRVLELSESAGPGIDDVVFDTGAMTEDEYLAYLEEMLDGEPGSSSGWDGTVIVANGTAIADAMAASPLAYQTCTPVLLVRATDVPGATADALAEIGELHGDVGRALVVGGAGSVPEVVAERVSPEWRRLGGKTRYDIGVSVANYAVAEGLLSWEHVGVASGTAFADGLAAGPAMGAVGGVLLLTPSGSMPPAVLSTLSAHSAEIGTAEIFGGPSTVSEYVAGQVKAAITYNEF